MQYSLTWGIRAMNGGPESHTGMADRDNNLDSEQGSKKLLEITETKLFCKGVKQKRNV